MNLKLKKILIKNKKNDKGCRIEFVFSSEAWKRFDFVKKNFEKTENYQVKKRRKKTGFEKKDLKIDLEVVLK